MSEKGTEPASQQRKQKAKDRGDIVRSRELLSAAAMLAGVLVLGAMAQSFVANWGRIFAACLRMGTSGPINSGDGLLAALRPMFAAVLAPIGMVLGAGFLGALSLASCREVGCPSIPMHSSSSWND